RFLYECTSWRTRENIEQIVRFSAYSGESLRRLREETGIRYDALTRGILHYYVSKDDFDVAVEAARLMRPYGVMREVKTPDEAIAIEPALSAARARLVGATYTATDESGDAHLFTRNLADLAAARGVSFRYGHA